MKTILRGLKWLAILVTGLILSLVLCWWLIPDQKLDPGAQELLAQPALPPASKNAYFVLWGLKASPELDAHAVGRQIIAEHERLVADKTNLVELKQERFLGKQPLVIKPAKERCDIERQQCLVAYQNAETQIRQDFARYAPYIERYRSLRNYPQYSERVMSWTIVSPFPDFGTALNLGVLVDGWIALQVAVPGTRKAALEELTAETILWRRMLRDSDSLISQMVATATLQRKYRLASEIMAAYPDTVRQYPDLMAQITAPLSNRDAALARSLAGEFRAVPSLYHDLEHSFNTMQVTGASDKIGKFLIKLGAYRVNASINQVYANHVQNVQRYTHSPKEVLSQYMHLQGAQLRTNWWNPLTYFYNPVGKIFASIEGPDYDTYAFRVYDLIGYSRMVELQRRIVEANIPPERIPAVLNNVGLNFMDPYTEQAFEFDAANKTLSFAGHGARFLRQGRMVLELSKQ